MARRRSPLASPGMSQLRRKDRLPTATLGRTRKVPFTYTPGLLEAVPARARGAGPEDAFWVCLGCLRFSSLCPVTGQPDWAELDINYIPTATLVESKSLKEYLTSFRNHGDFHEDVIRVIRDDLAKLLDPRYLEVEGRFDSRGSIAIWPFAQHARPGDALAERIREHRLLGHRPGSASAQAPLR